MCGHRPVSLSDPVPAVIVCALSGNMWPGKKRVDQAFACEGADENSWQSRPRHTRARNKVLLSAALVVCQ